MIPLPGSLTVKRSKQAEAGLHTAARGWIEGEARTPGLHASDLLDERQSYFKRMFPKPLTDRDIVTFLVGKVLHAFVLNGVDSRNPADISLTDTGSETSDILGITFSPDSKIYGKIRELKTSRSFYEPKDVERDLGAYIEQLLIYMVAEQATESQLWILFLNLKNEEGRTVPSFRAYDIAISENDLKEITAYLQDRVKVLQEALDTGSPAALPLCRFWKCNPGMCAWWEECKPEGRYDVETKGKKKRMSKGDTAADQP